jgi:lysyl-tRNA synthetase class 2
MSRIDETIQAKKDKRAQLEAKGVTVHPYSFDKKQSIAQALDMKGQKVQTAGRVMAKREHGKVAFFDLKDSTGSIQVLLHQKVLSEGFDLVSLIDPGDFVGVFGEVDVTKTGEITIKAETLEFHGKALRPLPTSFNAAADKEVRFRKRYLDMLVNPDARRVLDARWLITKELRRYLQDRHDFTEVETPILQPLYGGTNATPFTTHMKALDSEFYLRVAPELYLKRLIVGGYERIFEIARNFRNEGIDQTHQPEFSMIEWYHAYADYHTMMDVAEGLIKHLVKELNGETKIQVMEQEVEIGGEWPRITIVEALEEYQDIKFDDLSDQEIQELMGQNEIELIGEFTRGKAMFALFDKLVADQLVGPIWIIDYPRDVSPLSKRHRLNPKLAERFECYIGGKELCDGWSEIVDPIDQRNIFENEQKRMRSGDDEAHPLDEDFIEAMEYGMPPLGGIGMGIDRLVMFLTNTWSIKEVIAFPTLRPLINQDGGDDVGGSSSEAVNPVQTQGHAAKIEEGAKDDNFVAELGLDNDGGSLPSREESQKLLEEHVQNEALRHHCQMVAQAMEAYAQELGEDSELWYQAGLLHDLDWEEEPDLHPRHALKTWLKDYPLELREAVAAHAPGRTGRQPQSQIERYLFACDELSGLMHAVSLMRPNGFSDMKYKSVKKKLKDKSFAANVSRDDINQGFELIGKNPQEHVEFLVGVFKD